MHVIRDLASTANIADPEIRQLVAKRIDDLGDYDPNVLGYFLVIEPGDTLETINTQLEFPILCGRNSDSPFGQPDFNQSFEFVEEFPACYDMVFIISDDGFGIEVFISKTIGVDPELLAMCARYATPAPVEEGGP